MAFSPIEIIASIIVIAGLVKFIILMIAPNSVMNFAKKVYAAPQLMMWSAVILASIVLYYLLQSGMSIVQILAVTAFAVLLIVVSIAPYAQELLKWIIKRKMSRFMQEQWLTLVLWTALLVWGFIELFVR